MASVHPPSEGGVSTDGTVLRRPRTAKATCASAERRLRVPVVEPVNKSRNPLPQLVTSLCWPTSRTSRLPTVGEAVLEGSVASEQLGTGSPPVLQAQCGTQRSSSPMPSKASFSIVAFGDVRDVPRFPSLNKTVHLVKGSIFLLPLLLLIRQRAKVAGDQPFSARPIALHAVEPIPFCQFLRLPGSQPPVNNRNRLESVIVQPLYRLPLAHASSFAPAS